MAAEGHQPPRFDKSIGEKWVCKRPKRPRLFKPILALEPLKNFRQEMILDVLLPGLDGVKVCRAVRAAGVTTPILMLTALGEVEDRVTGLDAGADDYLVKPFSFDELLARMRALARRPPLESPETVLIHRDLSLDLVKHQVLKDGDPIALSATEFRLLEFFMRNPGQVISRSRILEVVWGYSRDVESNVVDTYVHYLRNKIDDDGESYIRTVRGAGYALGI